MAGKSNTELIREMGDSIAVLKTRADAIQRDIDRLREEDRLKGEQQQQSDRRLVILETLFSEHKKAWEERDRRRWAFWPAVVGAIIGSSLTQLGNFLVWYFRQ